MAHELEQIIQTGHLQIAVPTHGITISRPVTEEMVHLARHVQKSDTAKNRNNLQQACIAFRGKHRKEKILELRNNIKLRPVSEIMATIKDCEERYSQGLITRGEFLQAVAHTINTELVEYADLSLLPTSQPNKRS